MRCGVDGQEGLTAVSRAKMEKRGVTSDLPAAPPVNMPVKPAAAPASIDSRFRALKRLGEVVCQVICVGRR